MGFWSRLLGRAEYDTTVSDYVADAAEHGGRPAPGAASDPFAFVVDDVFTIHERGTVVTGRVASGVVRVGDTVRASTGTTHRVTDVEMFRKRTTEARAGELVGLLLTGATRENLPAGTTLSAG